MYGYVPPQTQGQVLSYRSSIAQTNAWQASISRAERVRRLQIAVVAVVVMLIAVALIVSLIRGHF